MQVPEIEGETQTVCGVLDLHKDGSGFLRQARHSYLADEFGPQKIVHSQNGLLTTVCYQFGGERPIYALEGSIAITGAAVQWLRDNLGIIENAAETEVVAI